MRNEDIIRAWKDAAFYASLSQEARAQIPAHPAGMYELSDEDLEVVAGGSVSAIASAASALASKVVSYFFCGS